MSLFAFNDLLFQLCESDLGEQLRRLLYIFKDVLPDETRGTIHSVADLFEKLRERGVLDIDDLSSLKEALRLLEKHDLVAQVEAFEAQRREGLRDGTLQRHVINRGVVSLQRAAGRLSGAISMKTAFQVAAGGVVFVAVYKILGRCSSIEEFCNVFNSCVLPAGTKLMELGEGSVNFIVRADNLAALKALWNRYQEGKLREDLQTFLVTEEIKHLGNGEELEVNVTIDEDEYNDACLYFMKTRVQEIQEGEQQTGWKRRWCSESDVSDNEAKAEQKSLLLRSTQPLVEELEEMKMFTHGPMDEPRFKDLSEKTLKEVSRRLEGDKGAWENFLRVSGLGVSDQKQTPKHVFRSYPDTTIASLKATLKALGLCDIVELLEGVKPMVPTSLNLDRSVEEVEKLRKTDDRIVTYHSSAAVLMFENIKKKTTNKDATKKIRKVFQELNPKNMVKVINVDGYKVPAIHKRNSDMKKALAEMDMTLDCVRDAMEQVGRVLLRDERVKVEMKESESGEAGLKDLERKEPTLKVLERGVMGMKELEREKVWPKEIERGKMRRKELEKGKVGIEEYNREGIRMEVLESREVGEKELESGDVGKRGKVRIGELEEGCVVTKKMERRKVGMKGREVWKGGLEELERGGIGMKKLERGKVGLKELEREEIGKVERIDWAVLLKAENMLKTVKMTLNKMEVFLEGGEVSVIGRDDLSYRDNSATKLRSLVRNLRMHISDGAGESVVQQEVIKLNGRKEMAMKEAEMTRTQLNQVKLRLMKSDHTEKLKTDVSATLDEWLLYQDKFDFFAVLDFALKDREEMDVVTESVRKIQTSLPGKTKLFICSLATRNKIRKRSDALYVSLPREKRRWYPVSRTMVDKLQKDVEEILSKRWQTSDLFSMMLELKRTVFAKHNKTISIADKLPSLVRFQKLQDKEDVKTQ